MKTKNEYREYLADTFIKSIEEEGLNWKKGWVGLESPRNPVTGVTYRGVNRFVLSMVAQTQGYEDPRWCTFKQIQDNKWNLEKGSKGVQIEYWVPLHPETNKPTTWDKANEYRKENPGTTIKSVPTFFYVFNAEHIKGISERELRQNVEIKIEDIVPKISQNMGVEIVNDTSNRAYYSTREDRVHLPKPEQFLSSYDYHATAMHELAHASGAESRLHRDLSGRFGTPSYAFEELVAEMSATFMSEHLPYELPEEHLESHKAYIQSWTQAIKDNPEYLIQAIKKADECANYLEEKGEIERELQRENVQEISKEVTKDLSLEERYTEAMKIAGYERIPTPEDRMIENVSFQHRETGEMVHSDGWGGIGGHLEDVTVNDNAMKERFEQLIHPQDRILFYTQNLNGDGDMTIKTYFGIEAALDAYIGADLTDGKTIGMMIGAEQIKLASFDTVEFKNISEMISYPTISEIATVNELSDISKNRNMLQDALNLENTYSSLYQGYQEVIQNMHYSIDTQESLWGAWGGRIANNSRPQDYIEIDIVGYERTKELTFNIMSVHANEIVDSKEFTYKFTGDNLSEELMQALDAANNQFIIGEDNYLMKTVQSLQTDYDKAFTLYAPFKEQSFDKHYELLNLKGYESFPTQPLKDIDLKQENPVQPQVEQTQQPKALDIRTVVPENEFKQIDRAKGDVHIFQDKKDAGNNFLGKRQEVNGVKSIKKLSPAMDLKTANEKLKEIRLQAKLEKPEQTLQKAISKSQALSIGRGR